MTTELQKDIDAVNKHHEQWLEKVKDVYDMVDNRIKELEEPYKTEFMLTCIKDLRECVMYSAGQLLIERVRFLYEKAILDCTIAAHHHTVKEEYSEVSGCIRKIDKLYEEYEEFLQKEGLK